MSDFDPTGTIRVLGYRYRIQGLDAEDIPTLSGTSDVGRVLIRVDKTMAPDHIRQVTLHEIIHAISEAAYAELDERQVHTIARGIYAVCRDNPEYMKELLFGG